MTLKTAFLAAAAAILSLAEPVWAQDKLIMVSLSPGGSANSRHFQSIATRLTEASNGTLQVEARDGQQLATFGNAYQRVLDDVIQIGWILFPQMESTFPKSTVSAQPLVANDGGVGSAAFWRLYKSGLLDSEFKDVVPLVMIAHMPYQIHLAKAPPSATDLGGLKVVAASKSNSDVIKALNGTPISLDPGEMYESIQRGLAGGAIISWSAFAPYKLAEVTTYHIEGPVGTTSSMLFLSRKKFDALPAAGRRAIDTVGGEALSREFGEFLKGQWKGQRDPVAGNPSRHTIKTLTDAEIQALEPKLGPLLTAWAQAHPGRAEVLEKYRGLYADVRAGR